jgi:phosphatidylglycerol---prolipoprotein diacylglyceryl transferase
MGQGPGHRSRRQEGRSAAAVIPYFQMPGTSLPGGLPITVFAVLACLGVATGCRLAMGRGREAGVPPRELRGALIWVLSAGFLGAHLAAILLYAPALLAKDHLLLLKIGLGMSSFGGFAGAPAGAFFYFSRRRRPWLAEADILVEALVAGWIFERLGCALVHDHIGARTSFFLGIKLAGGVYHDLGLYEFLYTLGVLWPAVWLVRRRALRPGSCAAAVSLLYAPFRFALDFLRITDARYMGMTPAQYGAIALAGFGACMLIRSAVSLEAAGEQLERSPVIRLAISAGGTDQLQLGRP